MAERAVKYPVLLKNVQAVMAMRKLDQSALADEVGASQGSVSRWGVSSVPRGDTLTRLAALARVTPSDFIAVPLDKAKRAPVVLPSGPKLVETMEALLDSAGLPHLVDDYAGKLARLLPTLLEGSEAPVERQARGASQARDGTARPPAKGDPAQQR